MNIAEVLSRRAQADPAGRALIAGPPGKERVVSFAELDTAAARGAALLGGLGLRPGDPVLVLLPMGIELYAALIALFRLGLVAVFLDPSAGRGHVERCCTMHPPRALIASARAHLLRLLSPALRRIPVKLAVGCPVAGAASWRRSESLVPRRYIAPCEPETPALLTFTSGSTGLPKAAVRSHGFLLAQHRILADSIALEPGEVDLATLPVFVLANLASGVTSLLPHADLRRPGAIDPVPVMRQITAWQPGRAAASPAFFQRLAGWSEATRQSLASLRKVYTGGAPVFPPLLERLQGLAPQARVVAVYGSTEAEPIAHVTWDAIDESDRAAMRSGKGLLAGKPVPQIRLCILRDHWGTPVGPFSRAAFDALRCPPGEVGEIVVSGEHVLPGYLRAQGDEETKFEVEGARWHRTGDAGYLDRAGRLWLVGRCAARIEDTTGVLYPFSVECAAVHHPAVRRAAVVSHAGRRLLVVEPEPDERPDVDALGRDLAWAALDRILTMPRIPVDKRHNAKVDYPALTRRLARA